MMVTIVIGMLASPLQISTIINQYKSKNNDYDTFLHLRKHDMSTDFAYKYVYQNESFEGEDRKGNKTVVVPTNDEPGFTILSPGYKIVLDQLITNADKSSTEQEKQALVAEHINHATDMYRQGGLISLKTDDSLKIQEGSGYAENPNLKKVIDNLADLLLEDLSVAVQQGYGTNFTDSQVVTRAIIKLGALFQNNKLDFDLGIAKNGGGNFDKLKDRNIDDLELREGVLKPALIKSLLVPEFKYALDKTSNSY
jgi:hypothetical protein